MPSLSEDLIAQALAHANAFAHQNLVLVTPNTTWRVARLYAEREVPLLPKRERSALLLQYETVFTEAVNAAIARQFKKESVDE